MPSTDMTDHSKDNLLRIADVMSRTGMGRTTIYRRIKAGTFPSPIRISEGLVAWYESELDSWIAKPMEWRAAAKAA